MAKPGNKEMLMERVFNAPIEDVWKYWTDETLVGKWWGPRGFTAPISQINLRKGGEIYIVMEDAEGLIKKGSRYPMKGVFTEIIPMKRLEYISSAIDEKGNALFETKQKFTFEPSGKKTKVTLHVTVTKSKPEAAPMLAGMEMGWSQSLDKLVEALEAKS